MRSARGADGEEAGWGEDSDDEPDESVSATTGQADLGRSTKDLPSPTLLLHPDSAAGWGKDDDCRDRANSVISDGSYDVVSGATSTARASPKLTSKELRKGDDSDDDWE